MKHNHLKTSAVIIAALLVLVFGSYSIVFSQGRSTSAYQITIYVNEGHGERNGHVFVGLTAGQTTVYGGWYPKPGNPLKQAFGKNGGEVRNDESYINECKWDVKKTYNITRTGYQRALNGMVKWDTDGRPWALNNHCGNFAETIAQMAGVPIALPQRITDGNRPELFGEYLRAHEGESSINKYDVNRPLNTGLFIRRGDKVSIKASGTVYLRGKPALPSLPEGTNNMFLDRTRYNIIIDLLHGCLIGRVGTKDMEMDEGWWKIGNGLEVVSEATGVLELNLNDSDPDNNEGTFEVKVKICPAPLSPR